MFIVAYHLLYLYESLLYLLYYLICMKFVARLSQKFLSLSFSNFHSIFVNIRNRQAKLFSVITQPWRHPGAILWIHVIIHIFITIHSKSTIFNAHKLQDMPTYRPIHIRALPNPRACARVKILKCSKSPINNFEYEPGHLEHFKIFRPYVSARALCARSARKMSKFKIFAWFGFLLP